MMRFILLLFAFSCLSACSQQQAFSDVGATSPVIGFSQSGTESNWRKAHTDSIITELEKEDYQVLYRNGYLNQDQQIQDLRRFITYKVDMIILAPLTEGGWDVVLKEAKEAGIPVIVVDRNIQTEEAGLYITHIGPSFKAEGNRAGLYLSNYASTRRYETLNVLEIKGIPDAAPTILRHDGFIETIGNNDHIQISLQLQGDFIRSKAKEMVRKAYHAGDLEQIDVIYSHSDEMTLGAIEALEELEPERLADLLIISIDGQKEAIDLLKDGVIHCVVECNPHVGWYVQNAVSRYFNNQSIPSEIYVPETVFSDQGDLTMIPTRNY